MLIALTFYVLLESDYSGAGELVRKGPRTERNGHDFACDRAHLEANHVWLIEVVTIYSRHFLRRMLLYRFRLTVPLAVMLIGSSYADSAFAFRTHDVVDNASHEDRVAKFWTASSRCRAY